MKNLSRKTNHTSSSSVKASTSLNEKIYNGVLITQFVTNSQPIAKDKLIFCLVVFLKTIEACIEKKYTAFDAHTTANCCHGTSILVSELIELSLFCDLFYFRNEAEERLNFIKNSKQELFVYDWKIPKFLKDLMGLYVLAFVKEVDLQKGDRTNKKKLKTISPIGTRFCDNIVDNLQKYFSHLIAKKYSSYAMEMEDNFLISGAPICSWAKYVKDDFLREDKCGIKYAPALFSMQIALAHLLLKKSKLSLLIDLKNSQEELKDRFLCVFEGDGEKEFKLLSGNDLKKINHNDAVVVFGGCVYSDEFDINTIILKINPWLHRLSNLILACDVFYPQFPFVKDDPHFDNTPIMPHEEVIKKLIKEHSKIKGVSAQDPSLFCLTHIYSASFEQVQKVLTNSDQMALPINFVPSSKRTIPINNIYSV